MTLFKKFNLGNIELQNRVVMAPLTRSRAEHNIPNQLMAEYYRQRASAGLIIAEGTAHQPMDLVIHGYLVSTMLNKSRDGKM